MSSFRILSNPARGMNAAGLSGNQWTMVAWYRREAAANGTIIRAGALSAEMQSTANGADIRMMETNGFHGSDAVFSVADGEWVWVVIGANNTTYYGYAYRDEVTENRTSLGTSAPGGATPAPTSCFIGGSSALSPYNSPAVGEIVHFRYWNSVLTQAELDAERLSATAVKAGAVIDVPLLGKTDTGSLTMAGTVDTNYATGSGYPTSIGGGSSAVDLAGAATAGASATGALGVKKLKLLVNSAAIGATVDGVVFAAGSGIVGAEIGEFTGKTIVAGSGADAGKGVLLLPVTDFGGTALLEGDAPLVYLKNSTHFTPIWPGLVVPG